jgi:hypothetical protein
MIDIPFSPCYHNNMRSLKEFADSLLFQSMDTLPLELRYPDQERPPWNNRRSSMPLGIILRRKDKTSQEYVLVGNNVAGNLTRGCSCCSSEWIEILNTFEGWAPVWE